MKPSRKLSIQECFDVGGVSDARRYDEEENLWSRHFGLAMTY